MFDQLPRCRHLHLLVQLVIPSLIFGSDMSDKEGNNLCEIISTLAAIPAAVIEIDQKGTTNRGVLGSLTSNSLSSATDI